MNNVACMYKSVRKTNGAMTPAFHHSGLCCFGKGGDYNLDLRVLTKLQCQDVV